GAQRSGRRLRVAAIGPFDRAEQLLDLAADPRPQLARVKSGTRLDPAELAVVRRDRVLQLHARRYIKSGSAARASHVGSSWRRKNSRASPRTCPTTPFRSA